MKNINILSKINILKKKQGAMTVITILEKKVKQKTALYTVRREV